MDREFFELKAASLLHDPPHKAWIVLGKFKDVPEKLRGEKAHEAASRELASHVLRGTSLEGAVAKLRDERVYVADKLASAQDRILLGYRQETPWGTTRLKNMFRPEFSFQSPQPQAENVSEFAETLKKVLSEMDDPRIGYHTLFTLLEPLWYEKTRAIGPADTRVPNHSVFDHLYATAAMANWTHQGMEPDGLMLVVDLAGVQAFISSARKLGDYWAGSWLVSALSWHIVRSLVEKYGPDTLVIPTGRVNPFYIYWLLNELRSKGYNKAEEEVKKLANRLLPDGWPRQAVIPGTLTLVLPMEEPDKLREELSNRYVQGWKEIVNLAIKYMEEFLRSIGLGGTSILERLMEDMKLIEDKPPLKLRTYIYTVKGALEELSELKMEEDHRRGLLYHHMFTNIMKRSPSKEGASILPGALVPWDEITGKGDSSGRYSICTVCSLLPAILRRPSGDRIEVLTPLGYQACQLISESRRKISRVIRERESLCPYCMIKRVLPYMIQDVLEKLTGVKEDIGGSPIFSSTGGISALDSRLILAKELPEKLESVEKAAAIWERIKEDEDLLEVYVEERVLSKPKRTITPSRLKQVVDKAREKVERLHEDAREVYEFFVFSEAEEVFLNPITSPRVKKMLKRELGIEIDPKRYYAVLTADGDYMGEILGGNPPSISSLREYYKKLYSDLEKKPPGCDGIIEELVERLQRLVSTYTEWISQKRYYPGFKFPVSPSYHFTISRALIESMLVDIEVVMESGGFVVYAGGDDLKALLPVYLRGKCPLLETVRKTRRAYWALDSEVKGFHIGLTVVPALMASGRSYGIRVAHYRDPMRRELSFAHEAERLAKSLNGKDGTAISYGRGSFTAELFTNGLADHENVCKIHETLEGIWRDMEIGLASSSLLYDIETFSESLNEAALVNYEVAKSMLERIFKRNYAQDSSSQKAALVRVSGLSEHASRIADGEWLVVKALKSLRMLMGGIR